LAAATGVELLTADDYREFQQLGEFDTKSSSWVQTPAEIRERGGALFGDRRYGQVFIYRRRRPTGLQRSAVSVLRSAFEDVLAARRCGVTRPARRRACGIPSAQPRCAPAVGCCGSGAVHGIPPHFAQKQRDFWPIEYTADNLRPFRHEPIADRCAKFCNDSWWLDSRR